LSCPEVALQKNKVNATIKKKKWIWQSNIDILFLQKNEYGMSQMQIGKKSQEWINQRQTAV
jgi:hypothetical protein